VRPARRKRFPHLLRPVGRAALNALTRGRTLLAFDFDGTLAPIVDHPEHAGLPPRTRQLLAAVAVLYPCAVISGRARADLVRRLRGLPLIAVAGSHGAEIHEAALPHTRVRAWARALRRGLRHLPGLHLEVKPHGVAVHYRAAEDKEQARRTILSTIVALDGARHLSGNHVVEVLPAASPTKGDALAALRRRLKPRATLYVGDDVTDEDAFACEGPGALLPVRVGPPEPTSALFRLDAQAEVEALLQALVDARRD
jgi:trehalose 6-phosphate phosphatase